MSPATFRFPGLAALAGRAPLGGPREVAIATYVAARLAQDILAARGISPATRVDRSAQARTWLANVALPNGVRSALTRLIDAAAADAGAACLAVRSVIEVTAPTLDQMSRLELDQLAKTLEQEPARAPA